jgi:hypothetical protein
MSVNPVKNPWFYCSMCDAQKISSPLKKRKAMPQLKDNIPGEKEERDKDE